MSEPMDDRDYGPPTVREVVRLLPLGIAAALGTYLVLLVLMNALVGGTP